MQHHSSQGFKLCTGKKAAGLSVEDLSAFTSRPLAPIGLDKFVIMHGKVPRAGQVLSIRAGRAQRGLAQVSSAMPFALVQHPNAWSHISKVRTRDCLGGLNGLLLQGILDRTKNDVSEYATMSNAEPEPQLLQLLEADVARCVVEPTGAATQQVPTPLETTPLNCTQAVRKLKELQAALQTLVEADRKYARLVTWPSDGAVR